MYAVHVIKRNDGIVNWITVWCLGTSNDFEYTFKYIYIRISCYISTSRITYLTFYQLTKNVSILSGIFTTFYEKLVTMETYSHTCYKNYHDYKINGMNQKNSHIIRRNWYSETVQTLYIRNQIFYFFKLKIKKYKKHNFFIFFLNNTYLILFFFRNF